MSADQQQERAVERADPIWAAQLVVLAAIVLDVALPSKVTVGPAWLLPTVECVLFAALVAMAPPWSTRKQFHHRRRVAIALIGLVSTTNAVSLVLLVHRLLHGGKEGGRPLILAGVVLWLTNVMLFALWYWEMDRGGPYERMTNPDAAPDWVFPQMQDPKFAPEGWRPTLVDYLYLSFTNSTAFSPTDAMPISGSAKMLMASQALVSLVTVALVVSRAVGILQ